MHSLGVLAGFCYTQFADTYQEANGLLYDDRRPKFPIAEIARATTASVSAAQAAEPTSSIEMILAASTDSVAPEPAPVPTTVGERPE